ncbi:MAG: ABC transporter substrate-binding protein [Cyanobacteria bacterium P01_F01_bin.143]
MLGLIALMSAIALPKWHRQTESITIAVVAPLSNTNEVVMQRGKTIVDSVKLYINQVNQHGGIHGQEIKLQVYDDQFNIEVAEQVAQKIANSQAVAVIGHYSSDTSIAAGKIYQKYQMPAITSTATVDSLTDNDWYFRTVFSNKQQGKFLSNYIEYVLKAEKVYLISGDSSYSLNLSQDIESELQTFGKELIGKLQIDSTEDLKNVSQKIIAQLLELKKSEQEPDVIVISSQAYQAAAIIPLIRNNNINSLILGGDSLTSLIEANVLNNDLSDPKSDNSYLIGVRATAPLIFDISGEHGLNFKHKFRRTYGYLPTWIAACNYDATGAVIKAISNIIEQNNNSFNNNNLIQQRLLVREGLKQINSNQDMIPWATREVYFDEKGDSLTPTLLGSFNHGKFISAFTQLKTIKNIDLVFNLDDKLASGEIFYDGQQYQQKTHIIYTGIDINEISRIDEKNSSYLMDFYLWFRYKGNVNPDDIEFTNYDVERLDSGEKLTLGEPIIRGEERGVKFMVYRVKADFYERFDFHHYPFDIQSLSVRFHHNNLTKNRLIYVMDLVGMRDKNPKLARENFNKNQVLGNITDWKVQKVAFFQDTYTNSSSLGYRRFLDTNTKIRYSRFNAVVDIQRAIVSFSIKNLLPLCFFIVVAYAILFLPHEDISVDPISGLLLAVVFYHLSLLESLPDGVGYVIVLDYAFYLAYFVFCSELLLIIMGDNKRVHNLGISKNQLLRTGKITLPIIWISGCLFLFVKYSQI